MKMCGLILNINYNQYIFYGKRETKKYKSIFLVLMSC